MNIGRIDPAVLRARLVDAAAGPHSFVVGQHLVGRVMEVLTDSSLLLAFGERQVLAHTALPLAKGQAIAVEVTKAGPTIELRVQPPRLPDSPASERNYELASLINALGASTGSAPGFDVDAARRVIEQLASLGRPAFTEAQTAALLKLFQPLAPGADRDALVTALREWLKNSGLLFEARLRSWLTANPESKPAALPEALAADLKVLLGQWLAPQAATPSRPSSGPREPGPTGQNDVHTGLALGASEGRPEALAERLLAQQAEFAYRWVADGVVAFELPVTLPGHTAQVHVRYRREPGEEPGKPGPAHIDLFVETERLGAIAATARWQASSLEAMLVVEREDAREVLEQRVAELSAPLGALFAHVEVQVCVGRVRRPSRLDLDRPELPGGSVLSVRA